MFADFALADIPSTDYSLYQGSTYTLRIATAGVLMKPSESDIINALRTDPMLVGTSVINSVRNPLFTRDFFIVFTMTKSYNYGTYVSMLLDDVKNKTGYDASVIDFSGGATADLKSPIGLPDAGQLTEIAQSGLSTIKWVAVAAALGIATMYVYPMVKPMLTRK